MLVQAFISKLAVETLDVAVLHRSARLDQDVANSMCLRPSHKNSTGELWAIIGAHCAWVSPKGGSPIQKPGNVQSGDAVIHSNIDTLVAEVIGYRQTLDAPTRGQAVADKIHAPNRIDRLSHLQWHPLALGALGLFALPDRQVGRLIEPIDPFVIHSGKCWAQ